MTVDVGKIIKTCRKTAHMSQEDLADLLHTTQATVSRIEKNVVSCEVNTFVRIVQATNTQDLAITMLFGADILTQLMPLVPAFAQPITQFFM